MREMKTWTPIIIFPLENIKFQWVSTLCVCVLDYDGEGDIKNRRLFCR